MNHLALSEWRVARRGPVAEPLMLFKWILRKVKLVFLDVEDTHGRSQAGSLLVVGWGAKSWPSVRVRFVLTGNSLGTLDAE